MKQEKLVKSLQEKNKILKKENKSLKAAAIKSENANKTKSAFLAHMSHDIRTPLNSIIGMANIAVTYFEDKDRVLDCLGKIDSSSKHLVSLINDILDMSRIESGKMIINYEKMDMREVINNCASITEGLIAQRDVTLVRGFSAFKHPLLIGDELHLRQILINILGNAIKFTPNGGKIFFNVKEIAHGHGKAVYHFEIEDTGIGMKQDFLKKIWDSFSQENTGNCSEHKGTGLGMAITKKLVDLMDGTISVESELNVGSKFVIEIKFDISTEKPKKIKISEKSKAKLNGMKVLLVEDVELNMEIAKIMLESSGIKVTTAENGQSAVNIFNNHPEDSFDAILMDVRMPIMDGLSATKVIRSLPRTDATTIPIIAMTADVYDEDVKKTTEAGMNAHLTKPVDQDKLFQTLGHFF